jgi:16S rRNA A1518/A1519 N6-dimethyltransferase RsmA/KsgA/DIM1 with predicted DNA glycosylase/AP lyase activity
VPARAKVTVALLHTPETLRNALKQLLPTDVIDQLPVDTGVRPENLSLQTFVELSNLLGDLDQVADVDPANSTAQRGTGPRN